MALKIMTPEEFEIARAKALATRSANTAARRASTLRKDFLDALAWDDLARQRGIRLPPWGIKPTPSNLRSWLRRAGIFGSDYEKVLGCSLQQYIDRNPDWPTRAMCGVALEYLNDLA